MLFHNAFTDILSSKAKISILRTLCAVPKKTFTSRELARTTDMSHTAILHALPDLEQVIIKEMHGNAHMLRINTESYAYHSLKRLFEEEGRALDRLIALLSQLPGTVAIFGSVAKGTEKEGSDVDVIIITDDPVNIEKIQEQVVKKFGTVLMPKIFSEKQIKEKKKTALVQDILKNHILIKGKL